MRETIVWELKGRTDATGDAILRSEPINPGQVLCIDLIAARNRDTANCVVEYAVEMAGRVSGLETEKMTTADYWYNYQHKVFVPSGYRVRLTFSDGGNNKRVEGFVYGYLQGA